MNMTSTRTVEIFAREPVFIETVGNKDEILDEINLYRI